MHRNEALTILKTHAHEIQTRFGVTSAAIFGSVARDQAGPESDMDLLVELDGRPLGFFGWLDLRDYLESLFGRRVDLGTPDTLHPGVRETVLGESVRAF